MTDLEFIKSFSKITIRNTCKELQVNSGNLYNGKAGKKNEMKVALALIKKFYSILDDYNKDNEDAILKAQEADPDSVYGFGHTPLFKNVIDAVNNDTEPLVNGEEGKKAMSIVLAAYKSRLTGLPVKFPLKDFSTLEMTKLKK